MRETSLVSQSLADYIRSKEILRSRHIGIGINESLYSIAILGVDITGKLHFKSRNWCPKAQLWCPRHGHYYDADVYHQQHDNDHHLLHSVSAKDQGHATEIGLSAAEDFIAGSFAGIASTVVGHPFDTIKVRLQMPSNGTIPFASPTECLKQALRMEGIRGLYRGLLSPMTSMPFVNAVVFGSYGQAKSFLQNRHQDKNSSLTSQEAMLAGGFAGLVNSVVLTPVELVKCRLQAQGESIAAVQGQVQYRGTWDCIRHILHTHGFRGLWKGQVATILREVPSYIGQFGTYELLRDVLGADDSDKNSVLITLLSGGIAGCVCWTVSYPQDVVKSRLQLLPSSLAATFQPLRYFPDGGFFNCMAWIVKNEGHRALWKGYTPCLIRAFPANGAGFFIYEAAKSTFSAFKDSP